MRPLPKRFYEIHTTEEVARLLIGMKLISSVGGIETAGRIVETEAYLRDDPACHAAKGITKRNRSMFLGPGHCYVYFVYGNHYCFNVVTAPEGIGEAVLIRAIEPTDGISEMARRADVAETKLKTDGPGKLCRALGIDGSMDGMQLWKGPITISAEGWRPGVDIAASGRIGIKNGSEMPLRFYKRV